MPIRSPAGHRAGDPHRAELRAEREFLTVTVRAFLDERDEEEDEGEGDG